MSLKIYTAILSFILTLNRISFDIPVAFNKTAVLISEYDENHKASNAIDGIKICPKGMLLAGSRDSVEPWLMIDLEDSFHIQKIVIYARNDRHGRNIILVTVKCFK